MDSDQLAFEEASCSGSTLFLMRIYMGAAGQGLKPLKYFKDLGSWIEQFNSCYFSS